MAVPFRHCDAQGRVWLVCRAGEKRAMHIEDYIRGGCERCAGTVWLAGRAEALRAMRELGLLAGD